MEDRKIDGAWWENKKENKREKKFKELRKKILSSRNKAERGNKAKLWDKPLSLSHTNLGALDQPFLWQAWAMWVWAWVI